MQEVMEARERTLCEQEQRQTKHDWDGAGDGEDQNSVQMTNDERDDTNDSQALTAGDITEYTALVPRISFCHKIDQISSLRQCMCAVRWQHRHRLTWNGSRGLEGISW